MGLRAHAASWGHILSEKYSTTSNSLILNNLMMRLCGSHLSHLK
jgi:hypothetical protein